MLLYYFLMADIFTLFLWAIILFLVQDKAQVQHQISILIFLGLVFGVLMFFCTRLFGVRALTCKQFSYFFWLVDVSSARLISSISSFPLKCGIFHLTANGFIYMTFSFYWRQEYRNYKISKHLYPGYTSVHFIYFFILRNFIII